MRYIPLLIIFFSCIFFRDVEAQVTTANPSANESKAVKAIRAAYDFQKKLDDSTTTIDRVIVKWSSTANDPDVKNDPNSLAIALGSEGLLEIRNGNAMRADSLLKKSMPLFRSRMSKASFLVGYAELERSLLKNAMAMRAYDEIVNTMDSVGALWDIQFYRLSGYAPYAYAIDACFGMEQIASSDTAFRKKAIDLLTQTMNRHTTDALGLMAIVSLHQLGAMSNETYKFQVDLLCSRKPELRKACDTFEKKFSDGK